MYNEIPFTVGCTRPRKLVPSERRHNFLDLCSKIRTATWKPTIGRRRQIGLTVPNLTIDSPPFFSLPNQILPRIPERLLPRVIERKISISYPFCSRETREVRSGRRVEGKPGWDEDVKLDHRCVSGVVFNLPVE